MGDSTENKETEEWEARLAEYALGVMAPGELADFERGLNECRAHVTRADEYAATVGALGMVVHPIEPPAGHKQRFLSRLASTGHDAQAGLSPAPAHPSTRRAPVGQEVMAPPAGDARPGVTGLAGYRGKGRSLGIFPAATALAAILLVAVGLWAVVSLQQKSGQLNIPPSYAPFAIKGQGPNPDAFAVGFVNRNTNEVTVVAQKLPQLSANEVYELWWIPPGFPNTKAVAAGTFNAESSGQALHSAHSPEPVTSYVAVAVTREPAPGGAAARGPVVLLGAFQAP